MKQLEPTLIRPLVERLIAEDVGRGDVTTQAVIPAELEGRARIEAREEAMVAGLDVARMCFEIMEPGEIEWHPKCGDGDLVKAGDTVVVLETAMRTILTAERTALNLLARMSGVATSTAALVAAVAGTSARVVDTRKTMPGLRVLDKYAVRVAGASNHRFGLGDGVLIKDNHVAAVGGVVEAVRRAKIQAPHGLRVEVEVQSMDELDQALEAGADVVLLDNMTPQEVGGAVERTRGRALLEASGGITLHTARAYAETGVDLISSGAITHSARNIDFSLEVEH